MTQDTSSPKKNSWPMAEPNEHVLIWTYRQ